MAQSRTPLTIAAIVALLALTVGARSARAGTLPDLDPEDDGGDGDGDGDGGGDGDGDGDGDGGVPTKPDLAPTPPPSPQAPIDLDPWLNEDPYWPMPETFYEIEVGDRFLGENTDSSHGIVYSVLLSAAYAAAIEVGGVGPSAAQQFALSVATNVNARLDYLDLIYCSPWNDSLYGTYGYDVDLIGSFDSPAGRSIRLLPVHYDNFERISQGLAPRRNVRLGTLENKGDRSGTPMDENQNSFELLWLPGLNLNVLWESQGETITTQGLTWEDGSNKLMPPPVVAQLSAIGVPSGQWGCSGY
jgi:hypothetical protein